MRETSGKPLRVKKFAYFFNRKPAKDRKTLERIRKLAILPAWTDIEGNTA